MKKVPEQQVATPEQASKADLPDAVQASLGELAGAAREGLLALSVGVGLGVVHELMAAEVDDVVGPKGKHDPERSTTRHGSENGAVTLGGRRVKVERPRVRSADGSGEVPLATYGHFTDPPLPTSRETPMTPQLEGKNGAHDDVDGERRRPRSEP